jgi:hypothetical protein
MNLTGLLGITANPASMFLDQKFTSFMIFPRVHLVFTPFTSISIFSYLVVVLFPKKI